MSRRRMLLNWDFQDDVRALSDRGRWRLFAAGRLCRICPLEKRAPFDGGTEIEIRQVFEFEDFGAEFTPELREQEARIRQQIEKQKAS